MSAHRTACKQAAFTFFCLPFLGNGDSCLPARQDQQQQHARDERGRSLSNFLEWDGTTTCSVSLAREHDFLYALNHPNIARLLDKLGLPRCDKPPRDYIEGKPCAPEETGSAVRSRNPIASQHDDESDS
jgi:hypothetical protein